MSIVGSNALAGAAGQAGAAAAGFQIDRSLRIDDVSNATLTRTPSTAGNRRTWTLSFWIKRTEIGGNHLLFNAGNTSNGDHSVMRLNSDMFQMYQYGHGGDTTAWSGGNGSQLRTSAKFRDPSAWMHIVVAMDTTQATQSDRLKYYINGVLQTEFDSTSYPVQNSNPGYWNSAYLHCWGGQVQNTSPSGSSDFMLAEVNLIDGQALAATDFGEYDDNNVWQPKEFAGSYTTSGVSFDFAEQQLYAGGTREALFDGSTSTGCNFQKTAASSSSTAPSNTKRIKVTFPTAKTGVTKLRIYGGGNTNSTNKVWYNDDVSTMITNNDPVGWKTVYTGSAITINSISFGTSNGGSNLRAIEINDVVLTDAVEQGLNSFHLDFSDNSSNAALGTDSSGNSNTWTVNNISAAGLEWASTTWSNDISIDSGNVYLNNNDGPNGFDGSSSTYIDCRLGTGANNTTNIIWEPTGGISGVTKIRVNSNYATHYRINEGTWTTFTSNGSYAQIYSSTAFTLTKLEIRRNNNSGSDYGHRVTAYELNDLEVLDDTAQAANDPGIDSLIDTPTNYTASSGNNGGNYATLNPLKAASGVTLSNGNLDFSATTSGDSAFGTIGFTSGKFYWEATVTTQANGQLGIETDPSVAPTQFVGTSATSYSYHVGNGRKYNNGGSGTTYASPTAVNDVVGIAVDLDSSTTTLTFYKNGTSLGTAFSGFSGTVMPVVSRTSSSPGFSLNFGQRPFAYTPPTGYSSLVTTNLSDPTIADGSTAMDAKLWTGNGSTQTISGLNFSPDFIWHKIRSIAGGHQLYDIVRGTSKRLRSDNTDAESTLNGVTAFNSDGWTMTAGNNNNETYVSWAWDGGSSTVTNTDGSITSSVRANPSAGFSIVSYTGNGSAGATVGHGLNASPGFVIIKVRNGTAGWFVWHSSEPDKYLAFDTSAAVSNTGILPVTNSTIQFKAGYSLYNANTFNYIAYCFAPVEGYSAFGSYTGNGSADGPFVFTGHLPRFVIIKRTDASGNDWQLYDTERSTFNEMDDKLKANSSDAEVVEHPIDFLSNGFKPRNTANGSNGSGATYIYASFASSPFQTARAR